MSKYNFSMEKILDLRANKEKDVVVKFATIQNELHQQRLILSNLEGELNSLNNGKSGKMDINQMKYKNLYKQNLENQIHIQNEIIEETSFQLEDMRLDLVAAQKDRKIMEKLREKDFSLFTENQKSMEQKQLDEIAIQKFKPSY